MCRSIKPLFNFDPPTTEEDVRAAALQFVRKISGMNKPSKANEAAFRAAVEDIAGISSRLLGALEVSRPAKLRDATDSSVARRVTLDLEQSLSKEA